MSLIDVQRKVLALCVGDEPAPGELHALGDERVWRLYRELVRKRLLEELCTAFPRTAAAVGKEGFERTFTHYLRSSPPRERYFHAIHEGFAKSAIPSLRSDASLPPYAADLLAYEAALRSVASLDDRVAEPPTEFAFDQPAALVPALLLIELQHAVHQAPAADGSYAAGNYYLCVCREAQEKKARIWTLNAASYALMQQLSRGAKVSEAVQQVAVERGIAVDESFVDGLCTVLADFIERGVILGGR